MSENERPLPRPPKTPFGKKRMSEEEKETQGPLIADQMAMAAACGNLNEFMQKNLPDNEHARKLAMMMMGMTGMMPPGSFSGPDPETDQGQPLHPGTEQNEETADADSVPEDVKKAVMSGNMEELKNLLMREHGKRTGSAVETPSGIDAASSSPATGIEKEILDQLIEIASHNSVTIDWLIMRALKVYIDEYRKTGRL